MGFFTRDAPWIRRIFPPSTLPQTRQPFAVSEDIQLTQSFLASGQTQDSELWLDSFFTTNPGLNNRRTLIAPNSFTNGVPEVWRLFFVSMQVAGGGPTGDFDFTLSLFMPATNIRLLISSQFKIIAADTKQINIFPSAFMLGAAGFGQVSHSVPLMLPSGPGDNAVLLEIQQLSAQAVDTESLTVLAYILRNPTGLEHIL